jgi:CysZ protein
LPFPAGAKKRRSTAHIAKGSFIVLAAFAKAFGQLSDSDTRRVIWISIAVAILIFIGLWALVGYILVGTTLFQRVWLEGAVDLLGGLATIVVTWLLFPAVLSACIGLFLERIADATERRHYPSLPPVRNVPVREIIVNTARFLVVMIVCNLVILVFLPFPLFFPFVFYAVNGYLLGREYFELVALRRADIAEVRALRDVYRGRLFVAGVIIAVLLTVPLVNLLAPIVGTAAMVHLFVAWRQRDVGTSGATQNA